MNGLEQKKWVILPLNLGNGGILFLLRLYSIINRRYSLLTFVHKLCFSSKADNNYGSGLPTCVHLTHANYNSRLSLSLFFFCFVSREHLQAFTFPCLDYHRRNHFSSSFFFFFFYKKKKMLKFH